MDTTYDEETYAVDSLLSFENYYDDCNPPDLTLDPYVLTPFPSPLLPHNPSRNMIDETFGNHKRETTQSPTLGVLEDNKDNGASWDWDIIFEPAKQRWFSTGMTYDPMPALIHGYRLFEDSPGLYAAKEVFYSVEELDRASETTLRPTVKRTKRTKRTEEPPLEEANSSDSSFSKDEISKVWPSRTNYRRPSHSKKSSTSSTETPSEASREVHNNIEKRYRQRLNRRFDSLLASLPKSMVGADVDVVGECSNSTTVTPSKPRVLDLAKMYIDTLETETRNIERDNKGLEKTAKMLETAYRKRGLGSRNYFGEGWETRPRKY